MWVQGPRIRVRVFKKTKNYVICQLIFGDYDLVISKTVGCDCQLSDIFCNQ